MSWKESMAEFGGGEVTFLSDDGERLCFVVCGEPRLLEGKFKGQNTKRIGAAIVSEDGFTIFVMGMRVARRLAKHEDKFDTVAFEIIRHGAPHDQNASYEVNVLEDETLTTSLFTIKNQEYKPDELDTMFKFVEDMVKS